MNLIRKTIYFFQKEGAGATAKRIVERCRNLAAHFPNAVKERLFVNRYMRQIRERTAGREIYLLLYCFDWNTPLFQRPHQIALALSRRENAHVLFVSDEYRYDNFAGILPVNRGLDVISRRILPAAASALSGAKGVTVFKCWPIHAEWLDMVGYDAMVYDYMDDLSLMPYCTEELRRAHERLMERADLTVCTAQSLYEDALAHAGKAVFSPNAGDYAFFHGGRACPADPALARRVGEYSCVLGYYGCLAGWFDYDLVLQVARRKPDWCFVLVGQCLDGSVSRLRQAALKNIILYPAQPYQSLPRFISAFDIQTIPFRLNGITAGTSPVKLFEYMASAKPILTSNMPECRRYRSVTIYTGAEDFIEKVPALLANARDTDYLELLDQEAKANTWDARVREILKALEGEELEGRGS